MVDGGSVSPRVELWAPSAVGEREIDVISMEEVSVAGRSDAGQEAARWAGHSSLCWSVGGNVYRPDESSIHRQMRLPPPKEK